MSPAAVARERFQCIPKQHATDRLLLSARLAGAGRRGARDGAVSAATAVVGARAEVAESSTRGGPGVPDPGRNRGDFRRQFVGLRRDQRRSRGRGSSDSAYSADADRSTCGPGARDLAEDFVAACVEAATAVSPGREGLGRLAQGGRSVLKMSGCLKQKHTAGTASYGGPSMPSRATQPGPSLARCDSESRSRLTPQSQCSRSSTSR